tara:strand:- start:2379 stop:2723 length:345 start_codon:yes stop_codon:yes gene_type:complete
MIEDYKKRGWLYNRYWKESLSLKKIAEISNVSTRIIKYWMEKLEVEIKSHQQAALTRQDRIAWKCSKWLSDYRKKHRNNPEREIRLIKKCWKCDIMYDVNEEDHKHQQEGMCLK